MAPPTDPPSAYLSPPAQPLGPADVPHGPLQDFVALQDEVKQVLRTLLTTSEEVDDALQETFLLMRDALATFDPTRDFSKWVRGIARNVALRRRRHVARDRTLSISQVADLEQRVASEEGRESPGVDLVEIAAVRVWLKRLNPEQQRTVLLRYVDRLSVDQIAQRMAKSEAAVYMALSRMRGSLQHAIAHQRRVATTDADPGKPLAARFPTPADEAESTTMALRLLVTGMSLRQPPGTAPAPGPASFNLPQP